MYGQTGLHEFTVEATGAPMDFALGTIPGKVIIVNADKDTLTTWIRGMADGSALVLGSATGGDNGHKSENGISVIENALDDNGMGKVNGFSLGALNSVNVNGDTINISVIPATTG